MRLQTCALALCLLPFTPLSAAPVAGAGVTPATPAASSAASLAPATPVSKGAAATKTPASAAAGNSATQASDAAAAARHAKRIKCRQKAREQKILRANRLEFVKRCLVAP